MFSQKRRDLRANMRHLEVVVSRGAVGTCYHGTSGAQALC